MPLLVTYMSLDVDQINAMGMGREGWAWSMAPLPPDVFECEEVMSGCNMGYYCRKISDTTGFLSGYFPSKEPMSGRHSIVSMAKGGRYLSRLCESHQEWGTSGGPEWTALAHGLGYVRDIMDLPDHEEDMFSFDHDGSLASVFLPISSPEQPLKRPQPRVKSDILNSSPLWNVCRTGGRSGDCFYDCIANAINSIRPLKTTSAIKTARQLRWSIAHRIVESNWERVRDWVVQDNTRGSGKAYLKLSSCDQMREAVLDPSHYATSYDIREIYDDSSLDIIPIVVNMRFGKACKSNPTEGAVPVYNYMPMEQRLFQQDPSQRRFVVLYKKGEHFELMVRTDLLREDFGQAAVPVRLGEDEQSYRAVFTAEELPPLMHSQFINTVTNPLPS